MSSALVYMSFTMLILSYKFANFTHSLRNSLIH
jgi:hypothetical protein